MSETTFRPDPDCSFCHGDGIDPESKPEPGAYWIDGRELEPCRCVMRKVEAAADQIAVRLRPGDVGVGPFRPILPVPVDEPDPLVTDTVAVLDHLSTMLELDLTVVIDGFNLDRERVLECLRYAQQRIEGRCCPRRAEYRVC